MDSRIHHPAAVAWGMRPRGVTGTDDGILVTGKRGPGTSPWPRIARALSGVEAKTWRNLGHALEVAVAVEQHQFVLDCDLRNQAVDRAADREARRAACLMNYSRQAFQAIARVSRFDGRADSSGG